MNGRVYDPLLARFGTPDPMTEDPFSTQGWNRYTYVGNSPVNFTDPSGYCFLGCFWKPTFKAIGNFFKQNWPAILQITVTALCNLTPAAGPACAALGSFVSGVTSGNLGQALRGRPSHFSRPQRLTPLALPRWGQPTRCPTSWTPSTLPTWLAMRWLAVPRRPPRAASAALARSPLPQAPSQDQFSQTWARSETSLPTPWSAE
jgi:hypothetical protein